MDVSLASLKADETRLTNLQGKYPTLQVSEELERFENYTKNRTKAPYKDYYAAFDNFLRSREEQGPGIQKSLTPTEAALTAGELYQHPQRMSDKDVEDARALYERGGQ